MTPTLFLSTLILSSLCLFQCETGLLYHAHVVAFPHLFRFWLFTIAEKNATLTGTKLRKP